MWVTIAEMADRLGCSRRSVERALSHESVVEGVRLEERPVTEADFDRPGVTRRTSRLVRLVTLRESPRGDGSTEETIEWLDSVGRGEVQDTQARGGDGGRVYADADLDVRMKARMNAEKLRMELAERERNYLPREKAVELLRYLGGILDGRTDGIAQCLADTIIGVRNGNEARTRLSEAIDGILNELGDEVENEVRDLIEKETTW